MRLKYGDRETTVADFQRLELADTTGLALPLSIAASTPVMFTPDMPWHEALEKIDSEYRLSAVRVASLDSLNDDPHIKLGNRRTISGISVTETILSATIPIMGRWLPE